jgi:hypothetical protein
VKTEQLLESIAEVVLPTTDESPSATIQLVAWLQDKELLLILDHFEHLVHSDARSLRMLLREAPRLQILVTSRERLQFRGEESLEIQGLNYPDHPEVDEFETYDAVRFFTQKARQWQPNFTLEAPADRESMVQICQNIGGIPRALELYAYSASIFPLREILQRFEQVSKWGEYLSRALPSRQHSIKSMFNVSWQQLSEKEKKVLISLTIFEGSFTMVAAQAIACTEITVLLSLYAKSWLQSSRFLHKPNTQLADPELRYSPSKRYKIPALLHFYITESVQQDPSLLDNERRSHALYFMNFLKKNVEGLTNARCRSCIMRIIQNEEENINQAWSWSIEKQAHKVRVQIERDLTLFYVLKEKYQNSVQDKEDR